MFVLLIDKRLVEKRKIFVNSVFEGTFNKFLGEALSEKILDKEETEIVKR